MWRIVRRVDRAASGAVIGARGGRTVVAGTLGTVVIGHVAVTSGGDTPMRDCVVVVGTVGQFCRGSRSVLSGI